jgi:glyoxylase-like metal-dependent hydrolase (beta-lactamase superfamily II)
VGTNSNRIRPWLASLEVLGQLDVAVVVPGHGPAMRDRSYLLLVTELFESVVTQVDAALARRLTTAEEIPISATH